MDHVKQMFCLAAQNLASPHLDELVPSGGNDDGVGVGGRETDARDPL